MSSIATIISIILFIIICIGLVYTYYYFNPSLLNNGDVIILNNIESNRNLQLDIGIKEFEQPNAIRYFYDGWLRVNASPDLSTPFIIFNRGTDFIVTLTGHKLSIVHSYYRNNKTYIKTGGSTGTSTNAAASIDKITGVLVPPPGATDYYDTNVTGLHTTIVDIATNFPFQKWVYFCINVDGKTIDVYLDGKLTKSVTSPGYANEPSRKIDFTTFATSDPITVGNNSVKGKLARFRREPGNMDPQSVWNTYIQGAGQTGEDDGITGDYHARISLLKNNNVRRSMVLF